MVVSPIIVDFNAGSVYLTVDDVNFSTGVIEDPVDYVAQLILVVDCFVADLTDFIADYSVREDLMQKRRRVVVFYFLCAIISDHCSTEISYCLDFINFFDLIRAFVRRVLEVDDLVDLMGIKVVKRCVLDLLFAADDVWRFCGDHLSTVFDVVCFVNF